VSGPIAPRVLIKGAGEMASGVAWRLHRARVRRLAMLDLPRPLAVRRRVAFCEALIEGRAVVEGVAAVRCAGLAAVEAAWGRGEIAVLETIPEGLAPEVVIDAVLAKRNLGTRRDEAPLVIGLGPGFTAGVDVDRVIETNRGHDLGRVIERGSAAPNTGVPGAMAGVTVERVLRAPVAGVFETDRAIGERVEAGALIGRVAGEPVIAAVGGILRGLIRPGTEVAAGLKLGDIDPRGRREYCDTISDKARALGGAVLEALMEHANRG